jgi:AsmA protein
MVKWVLVTVAVTVVIFIVAALVLPRLVDPNRYKAQISAMVLQKTGKELTIGGDIEWRVFPGVALGVTDVALREPGDATIPPIASITEARVSLGLLPLIRKQIEVGRVDLEGASFSWPDPDSLLYGLTIDQANISLVPVSQAMTPEMSAGSINAQSFDLDGDLFMSLSDPELSGNVTFSTRIIPAVLNKQVKLEGTKTTFSGQFGDGENAVPVESTSSSVVADFDLANERVSIRDFTFTLFDLDLSGQLVATSVTGDPSVTGQVKMAEFNPRLLQRKLGMEEPNTRDPNALTALSGEWRFDYSAKGLQLSDVLFRIDGSQLAGNFKLEDFQLPSIEFELQVDSINLDDYSSPGDAGDMDGSPEEAGISVDTIRGFSGSGKLRVGSVTSSGLTATDIEASISGDRASIRIQPLNLGFYGGQGVGDITINALGETPLMRSNMEFIEVKIGDLLADLAGEASLRGRADIFLQVETDISTGDSSLQRLQGDMGLLITEGAIEGLDLAGILSLVSTALDQNRGVGNQAGKNQQTEFAEFSMTGVFKNGTLTSEDLLMHSALLTSTGNGRINLVDESLDFVLYPVLADDTGIEALEKISGLAIPVRVTGSLDSPAYKVDMEAALALYQKALLQKMGNQLLEKLLK